MGQTGIWSGRGVEKDFATSELRWPSELLLAEFTALREEIVTVKTQVERTYAYLFALVGAILASQLLSDDALNFLNEHPWLFLAAALLTMWLPINHQLMSADMILAGAYIRDIIAPKLNNLARIGTRDPVGHRSFQDSDALLGWSDKMGETPPNSMLPGWIYGILREPMSWEVFMAVVRMERSKRRLLFAPLYLGRVAILYAPTLLLLYIYGSLALSGSTIFSSETVQAQTQLADLGLAIAVALGLVWSVAGHFATLNLFRYGTHRRHQQGILRRCLRWLGGG